MLFCGLVPDSEIDFNILIVYIFTRRNRVTAGISCLSSIPLFIMSRLAMFSCFWDWSTQVMESEREMKQLIDVLCSRIYPPRI